MVLFICRFPVTALWILPSAAKMAALGVMVAAGSDADASDSSVSSSISSRRIRSARQSAAKLRCAAKLEAAHARIVLLEDRCSVLVETLNVVTRKTPVAPAALPQRFTMYDETELVVSAAQTDVSIQVHSAPCSVLFGPQDAVLPGCGTSRSRALFRTLSATAV